MHGSSIFTLYQPISTMRIFGYLCVDFHVLIISAIYCSCASGTEHQSSSLSRSSFPPGFVFGAGSSAYQVEGAANDYGKGPSIWDTFTHKYPEKIRDHSNGNIATDSYHQYKEDVKIMKRMGLDAYRFSISWPRLLPRGKLSNGINEEGIKYYNNLINELLDKGIAPYATLFHWDLPQALEDEYGGFLSPKIVQDFGDYAELCFQRFGDRVKRWTTINEPYSFVIGGYITCEFAPCRCSSWLRLNCSGGDSSIEPYLVAHNQLLAHGTAVKIYRKKYQELQKGQIGISMAARWMIPFSNEQIHHEAAARALDFSFGWYIDPLTSGDYPLSMRSRVRNKLPLFSAEDSDMLKGSYDFLGLNYYTTYYARYAATIISPQTTILTDSQSFVTPYRHGVPIGPRGASDWIYVYPRGIQDLLLHVKKNYNNPVIYITENGMDERNNSTLSLQEALYDPDRIEYYLNHLAYVDRAIKKGVAVKGFFAWALLDNFEWSSGYSIRFGLNYVDYKNGLKRYPKLSATWFKNFLKH